MASALRPAARPDAPSSNPEVVATRADPETSSTSSGKIGPTKLPAREIMKNETSSAVTPLRPKALCRPWFGAFSRSGGVKFSFTRNCTISPPRSSVIPETMNGMR